MSIERTSEVVAQILSDRIYRECISLAQHSKGDQRYGSKLIKNGVGLGEGYNRAIAHPSFGKLKRVVSQGYSNHAEIEALNDALMNGLDVQDAEIFVGGYFPKEENVLFLNNEFNCLRCPPILKRYGISKINVPTPQGWLSKNIDEAMLEAGFYSSGGTYNSRIHSVLGHWTIKDLTLILPEA